MPATDKVFVRNLCLHGFHGVGAEERVLGQKFYIDIDCVVDTRPYAADDDYPRAICYGKLCDMAKSVSDAGPYQLIETLADRIAQTILREHPEVAETRITVRKPSAPIAHALDHPGVEINRSRADV